MHTRPPKPPWTIHDACLQTWQITHNAHKVYVWSTSTNFRVMKTPTSFDAINICESAEEAFQAAMLYLTHCALEDTP